MAEVKPVTVTLSKQQAEFLKHLMSGNPVKFRWQGGRGSGRSFVEKCYRDLQEMLDKEEYDAA